MCISYTAPVKLREKLFPRRNRPENIPVRLYAFIGDVVVDSDFILSGHHDVHIVGHLN